MEENELEKIFDEVLKKSEVYDDIPESVIKMLMTTSFNNDFMSREEAIESLENMRHGLREQIYGKNSRLYFHASDRPYDSIRETIQPSGEKLCFFANNPESALSVVKVRHDRDYDFCFLHICKIKSPINLFNPQSKSDMKKVSFTQNELKSIKDSLDWLQQIPIQNLSAPIRWWRIYESESFLSSVKKAGFDGIALNFWDYICSTPEKEKTEGIALFNGNKMTVYGIKVVNLKHDINDRNECLKGLKTKEDIEKEYESILRNR